MTILHHPSEEVLLDLAAGRLGRGPALVGGAHVRACPACRIATDRFEAVGGALLEAEPPAAMAPDALARALARIGAPHPPDPPPARVVVGGIDLSDVLGEAPLGPRRTLGPGLSLHPILADRATGASTYLLRSGPGRRLAHHGHTGAEFVCVLAGSFSDETGRYGAGDFACSDDKLVHSPVTDSDGDCICLISTEGPMRMQGPIGKLIQPLLGL